MNTLSDTTYIQQMQRINFELLQLYQKYINAPKSHDAVAYMNLLIKKETLNQTFRKQNEK